ncbi:hypothetical protein [Blastococcus sp. CT_GayMR19]|nr:hypothetical protein [Blastococcus sp. CT_GayMR19]
MHQDDPDAVVTGVDLDTGSGRAVVVPVAGTGPVPAGGRVS